MRAAKSMLCLRFTEMSSPGRVSRAWDALEFLRFVLDVASGGKDRGCCPGELTCQRKGGQRRYSISLTRASLIVTSPTLQRYQSHPAAALQAAGSHFKGAARGFSPGSSQMI
jgi:hypothetical protein